jgi:hypothetical protein
MAPMQQHPIHSLLTVKEKKANVSVVNEVD